MGVIGSTPVLLASSRPAIAAGCAALLAVAVYVNALQNPFVYDDFRLIVENPTILNPWDLRSVIVRDITRPLVNISYALDTMIWGRIPLGYHITNLALHAINVMLVFWVALFAAGDRRRADVSPTGDSPTVTGFVTAAVFAVHPMMTEAVGYVTGRSELLFTFFFLLGFLSGRRWMIGGGRRWWIACIASWMAGVLAKETAAMLPAVLVAYDWFVLDGDRAERRRRFLHLQLPMLAVALAAGIGRIAVLELIEFPGSPGADGRYALVQIEVIWRYLALFLAPRGQSIFHAVTLIDSFTSLRAIVNLAALAAFLSLAWRLRRAHGLVGFGLVWFILLLVPTAVLFTLGRGEAMVERRTYLPAAGLFLILGYSFAGLWARAGRQRLLAGAAAVVFLASLSFLTLMRNVVWHDPVTLTQEAARLAPGHWMPRVMVGEAFRQSGQCPDAATEYRAAIALRPQEEFPYTRLAGCLIAMRDLDGAEGALQELRAVNPQSQDASMGLGVFALIRGQLPEARAYLREAIDREPARPRASLLLAFIDGTLPASEIAGACEELRLIAGGTLSLEMCQPGSQVDR